MAATHILTYAQTLDGGGVEAAQLRLACGWLAAGRRVTLVLGDRSGPLAADLPAGIEIVALDNRAYRALRALPRIVLAKVPDIVFCPGNHYTSAAAWLRLGLRGACPPIVAKLSNAPDRFDHSVPVALAHRLWLGLHGRFLDHLVAMTPATAAIGARLLRMEGRTSVIPNPPRLLRPDTAPLPAGRFVLGVGRLARQKRWDRLIAAMPLLPGDVALVLMGEGALRPSLEAQVRALGLEHRVHFAGYVPDPLAAMAAARVLALTSDYEGVPGVLREALSVGTPVVATLSSEAVPEIVADTSLGSIVPLDDPVALAAALSHWLDPPRPAPVSPPVEGAARAYLELFDRLA